MKFKRIVVIGCGGVGYWLTLALSREVGWTIPIEVWDPDTFEGGNGFKRLPKPLNETVYKVDLLKTHIQFVMGDKPPEIHKEYLTPDKIQGDWSHIMFLDCTDMDLVKREELWDKLESAGARGLRISYDGMGIQTISPGPPIMASDDTSGGYNILPNLPQSFGAAGLGAQAALFLLFTGEILDFQVHVPTPETRSIEIRSQHNDRNPNHRDLSHSQENSGNN